MQEEIMILLFQITDKYLGYDCVCYTCVLRNTFTILYSFNCLNMFMNFSWK